MLIHIDKRDSLSKHADILSVQIQSTVLERLW